MRLPACTPSTETSLRRSSALNLGVMKTFFAEEGGPEDDRVVQLQMMTMPEDALVNRMVAQTSAQPGILTCLQHILSPATASHLHCLPTPPKLQEQPYREVRRSYGAVVCGIIDSDGSVQLNPDDSMLVGAGSSIIQLARPGESSGATGRGGGHACWPAACALEHHACSHQLIGLTGSPACTTVRCRQQRAGA